MQHMRRLRRAGHLGRWLLFYPQRGEAKSGPRALPIVFRIFGLRQETRERQNHRDHILSHWVYILFQPRPGACLVNHWASRYACVLPVGSANVAMANSTPSRLPCFLTFAFELGISLVTAHKKPHPTGPVARMVARLRCISRLSIQN